MDRMTLQEAAQWWRLYITSRQALLSAGLIRSSKDTGADFAEWLVAQVFGGELAPPNNRGYDVLAGEMRIEVKHLAKSPNNHNGYIIKNSDRMNDPSIGATHYAFVFFTNLMPESLFLVPETVVRTFTGTQIRRSVLKDFEVQADWGQFQSPTERYTQNIAQMELFLQKAKEIGGKLQARRGLLPPGTAAEIIREIREERP